MDFFDLVTRGWNGLLIGAVACVLVAIEMAVPELFEKGKIGNRTEVFIPMGLCIVCSSFVPGPWMPENVLMSQKIVLGVIMGFAAYTTSGAVKRYGARFIAEKIRTKLGAKKDDDSHPE